MYSRKHAKRLAAVASCSLITTPCASEGCSLCQRARKVSSESVCFTCSMYPRRTSPNIICHFKTSLIALLSHHIMIASKLTPPKRKKKAFFLAYFSIISSDNIQSEYSSFTYSLLLLLKLCLSPSWSRLLCLLIPRAIAPVWAAVNHLRSACCQNQPL